MDTSIITDLITNNKILIMSLIFVGFFIIPFLWSHRDLINNYETR